MNFDFTDDEQAFLKNLQEVLEPFKEFQRWEEGDSKGVLKKMGELRQILAQIGYLRLGMAHTGAEPRGVSALMAATEMVSDVSPSLYLSVEMSTRLFGRIIDVLGQERHHAQWLVPLTNGETMGAVALSENSLNVDNDPLETEGTRSGEDILINGHKRFVINGPMADGLAVIGRLEDQNVIFLMDKKTTGWECHPPLETVGYNGTMISHVDLSNCRIPKDQVLGPIPGQNLINTIRMWENQIIIGGCLGLMKSSFEEAKAYADSHITGGKPIIRYQEIAFKLSEMLTLYQTSQLLAQRAVWTALTDSKEAESLTWCAKVFCAEAAEKIAGEALRILGGKGITKGNKSERAYRCAKYNQIAGTSTEIARVRLGDAALGIRN